MGVATVIGVWWRGGQKTTEIHEPEMIEESILEKLRKDGVKVPHAKFRNVPGYWRGVSSILHYGSAGMANPMTLEDGVRVIKRDKSLSRMNIIFAGTQMWYKGAWRDVMVGPNDNATGLCVGCAIEREQQGKYLCWK